MPRWVFVVVALAWGALVLGNHFRVIPVPLALVAASGARLAEALPHLTAALVGEHLAVLATVLVLLMAAVSAGRALLALLGAGGLTPGERVLFAAALGHGVLSYLAFGLTAVGLLTPTVAWIVVAALALAAVPGALRAVRAWWRGRGRRPAALRVRPLEALAVGALLVHGGVTLLLSLGPLIFYDALAYHFSAPHLAILNGRLMPMPENLLARFPAAGGYLHALAFVLKDESAAKVLCWFSGVGVVALIALFARRMAWTGVAVWAALPCATLFHVSQAAIAGGVDLQLVLYSACSVAASLILTGSGAASPRGSLRPAPLLVLSGLFGGLALATKYTGGLVPLALTVVLLLSRRGRGVSAGKALGEGAWLLGIAGGVASPWLVRNAVMYGNPVAPLFPRLFSPADAVLIQRTEAFLAEAAQRPAGWTGYLSLPWDITMGTLPNAAVFSPLFLCLLPLLLLFRGFPASLRRAGLFAGVFALGWALTSTAVRYLLPALPWACLLLAYWATRARLAAWLRGGLQGLILACSVAGLLASFVATFQQDGWRVVLGEQAKADYLGRSHAGYLYPPYALYQHVDAELPATARVLLVGETRGFYLQRDFVANSAFDRSSLLRWAESCDSPQELRVLLEREGITHLLLNLAQARHLRPYGMLRTTRAGRRTLEAFWRRYVQPLATVDELVEGQLVNRLTLHAITDGGGDGPGMPPAFADLLETP